MPYLSYGAGSANGMEGWTSEDSIVVRIAYKIEFPLSFQMKITVQGQRGEQMRLIDADALKKQMPIDRYGNIETSITKLNIAIERSTVEAVPVVHGHWIKDRLASTGGGTYGVRRCSACEWYCEDNAYKFNYCPRCGARMGEVE